MIVPLTPIRCLYRGVDLYGRKVGIVSGQSRFTYAEFGEHCERLAAGLAAEGIRPGDRVAYLSFNNNALLEGYYGVVLARAVVMPLNVRLTPPELISILNHSEARMLIFENDFVPLVDHIRKACPAVERYVTINDPVPQANFTYEELLSRGRIGRPDLLSLDENANAELFYTSGSTGTPKGVMLAHRTLYLHALAVAGTFNHDDTAVELHTIPLFHANGWGRPQASTMMGLKQVMVRRFEPTLVFRLIQEEKATAMSLVPTMANALLNAPDLAQFNLTSLKEIHVGRLTRVGGPPRGCLPLCGHGRLRTYRDVARSDLFAAQGYRRLRRRSRPLGTPGHGRLANSRSRNPSRRLEHARRAARHAGRG